MARLPENVLSDYNVELIRSKTEDAGRGLSVSQDIPSSTEIFRTAKPLVAVVNDTHLGDTCDNCFCYVHSGLGADGHFVSEDSAEISVTECAGCRLICYCSKGCQREAWKHHHKFECSVLRDNRYLPTSYRSTIRLILGHKHKLFTDEAWAALCDLCAHVDEHKSEDDQRAILVSFSTIAKSLTETELDLSEIEQLFCKVALNSMALWDRLGVTTIGSCLDPFAALINHSCKPNAHIVSEGNELRLRSLEQIPAGVELTITYTDPSYDTAFRRRRLKYDYFFHCTCVLCTSAGNGSTQASVGEQTLALAQDQLTAIPTEFVDSEIPTLDQIKFIETEVTRICVSTFPRTHWPVHLQPVPDLRFILAQAKFKAGQLAEALKLFLYTCFVVDPILYPCEFDAARISHSLELCRLMQRIVVFHERGDPVVSSELHPLIKSIDLVYEVLYYKLIERVQQNRGRDTIFAVAIKHDYEEEFELPHGAASVPSPTPNNKTKKLFKAEQTKLLRWAGATVSHDAGEGRAVNLDAIAEEVAAIESEEL